MFDQQIISRCSTSCFGFLVRDDDVFTVVAFETGLWN